MEARLGERGRPPLARSPRSPLRAACGAAAAAVGLGRRVWRPASVHGQNVHLAAAGLWGQHLMWTCEPVAAGIHPSPPLTSHAKCWCEANRTPAQPLGEGKRRSRLKPAGPQRTADLAPTPSPRPTTRWPTRERHCFVHGSGGHPIRHRLRPAQLLLREAGVGAAALAWRPSRCGLERPRRPVAPLRHRPTAPGLSVLKEPGVCRVAALGPHWTHTAAGRSSPRPPGPSHTRLRNQAPPPAARAADHRDADADADELLCPHPGEFPPRLGIPDTVDQSLMYPSSRSPSAQQGRCHERTDKRQRSRAGSRGRPGIPRGARGAAVAPAARRQQRVRGHGCGCRMEC